MNQIQYSNKIFLKKIKALYLFVTEDCESKFAKDGGVKENNEGQTSVRRNQFGVMMERSRKSKG